MNRLEMALTVAIALGVIVAVFYGYGLAAFAWLAWCAWLYGTRKTAGSRQPLNRNPRAESRR